VGDRKKIFFWNFYFLNKTVLTVGQIKHYLNFRVFLSLLKFSLGDGFERVFIFSVTLDTRKNERQVSVSTIET
jgi:hypothetical protein